MILYSASSECADQLNVPRLEIGCLQATSLMLEAAEFLADESEQAFWGYIDEAASLGACVLGCSWVPSAY